jgi:hypothetical protein
MHLRIIYEPFQSNGQISYTVQKEKQFTKLNYYKKKRWWLAKGQVIELDPKILF